MIASLVFHIPELFPDVSTDMKWVLFYIGCALAGIPATTYLGATKPSPTVLLLGSFAGPLTLLLAFSKWCATRLLVGELPRE